jgi:hypothetical protein
MKLGGFCMPDLAAQPFDQLLKTLKVVCKERVREIGTLAIKAPPGICLDECTNRLEPALALRQASDPIVRTISVCPGLVINHGVVRADLVTTGCHDPQLVMRGIEIPFSHVTECTSAEPGDVVQKHDLQVACLSVSGFLAPTGCDEPPQLRLELMVVVDTCIIVARETILKVNATEVFCR